MRSNGDTGRVTMAVLAAKLDNIAEVMGECKLQIKEAAEAQHHMDSRILKMETEQTRIITDVKSHEGRLEQMEKSIAVLMTSNKVLAFLGSALILSILGLVWSLITGQAVIEFS